MRNWKVDVVYSRTVLTQNSLKLCLKINMLGDEFSHVSMGYMLPCALDLTITRYRNFQKQREHSNSKIWQNVLFFSPARSLSV